MNEDNQTQPSSVMAETEAKENHFAVIAPCSPRQGIRLLYNHPCPYCGKGPVEYDSLLNLLCKTCGRVQSGAFT